MDHTALRLTLNDYVQAASDAHLSSDHNGLLQNLLSEEDNLEYDQLLRIHLSQDVLQLLIQLQSLLGLSSSASWMSVVLVKKLLLQQHSIDLCLLVACATLASKYQDSCSHFIDYELILHCLPIDRIQEIHDAESAVLDALSFDVSVTTPDHFFSYLSNLLPVEDVELRDALHRARSLFARGSISIETMELLHHYSSSVVTLSFMFIVSSNHPFLIEQVKTFLRHKKDASHYFKQLLDCLGTVTTWNESYRLVY